MLTCFYVALLFFGSGYIIFSFVVGEVVDFGGDVGHAFEGVSHSLGEALGNALEGLHGGAEAASSLGHADAALPEAGHEVSTSVPSPFGLRTIAMFLTGFGAGGLISKGLNWSDELSLLPAFGAGLVAGLVMWWFLKILYASQGSTSIQDADYLGLIGRVTISISDKGRGMVTLTVKGQRMNVPAVSKDGLPIAAHAEVEVISKEGGVAIVKETS